MYRTLYILRIIKNYSSISSSSRWREILSAIVDNETKISFVGKLGSIIFDSFIFDSNIKLTLS